MSRVLKTLVIISLLLGGFLSHAQDSKRKELENRRFELQQEIKRINALRTSNLKKQKSSQIKQTTLGSGRNPHHSAGNFARTTKMKG